MVIQQVLLNHKGGRYFYRIHNDKIRKLCSGKFIPLKEYLNLTIEKCPNEYFNNGPRGSCLKFKFVNNIIEFSGHEVSSLARYGLEVNKGRFFDSHSKVQTFMLENDKNTLAMEVPTWLMPNELASYNKLFNCNEVLTGQIDILRIDDGRIWVWDYKPYANKEIYAPTQIFFYAFMLSKRTGIPLEKFRCGYFDQNFAFVFKPEQSWLLRLHEQTTLV